MKRGKRPRYQEKATSRNRMKEKGGENTEEKYKYIYKTEKPSAQSTLLTTYLSQLGYVNVSVLTSTIRGERAPSLFPFLFCFPFPFSVVRVVVFVVVIDFWFGEAYTGISTVIGANMTLSLRLSSHVRSNGRGRGGLVRGMSGAWGVVVAVSVSVVVVIVPVPVIIEFVEEEEGKCGFVVEGVMVVGSTGRREVSSATASMFVG